MPHTPERRVELLAPAGNPEALIAAVNNGADAVYLGLRELNARRGADNFDLESLAEAARFAHLRDARVYLTANVIVLPAEMEPALGMVADAWAAGVDAVIVQDLGLLAAIRDALPEVRLHASTQIDAAGPDAVRALAESGVRRVTLARELSLPEVRACAATGVEIETFVHGALCYCYSGQCLMSSMIGRRSANRGMCAQPCRLGYQLIAPDGAVAEVPGRYLLSPKDVAGIAHLPALAAAGVTALKIEGRMKSAEYVAIVTGVYRAALDRALADPDGFAVAPAEWDALEEAFSRGFTDAYLLGERGPGLMSYTRPNNRGVRLGRIVRAEGRSATVEIDRALDPADTIEVWTRSGRFAQTAGPLTVDGHAVAVAPAGSAVTLAFEQGVTHGDRVFRVASASLLAAARRTYAGAAGSGYRARPVDVSVSVRVGEPARVTVTGDDVFVTAEGPVVETARTSPVTADAVIEHVGRMGGTGYRPGAWDITLDADAGLGYSVLHRLRREALERLDELRLAPWSARRRQEVRLPVAAPARPLRRSAREVGVVATAWASDVALACRAAGADECLLRVFGPPGIGPVPDAVQPLLPRVVRTGEADALRPWLDAGPVTVGELGMLARASGRSGVAADWTLNAVNARSAGALARMGASFLWASPELSGRQLASLVAEAPIPVGAVIWGRLELMLAEQCVLQAAGGCDRRCRGCDRRRGWWRLRDQKGYEFPVTTDPSGRAHIVNSVTLDLVRALDEVVATGVSAVRLEFTDETPERAAEVVAAVRSALGAVAQGMAAPAEPLVEPSTSGHFFRGVV